SAHSNPAYITIRSFVILDPDGRPILWNSHAKIVHYFEFQNQMRPPPAKNPLSVKGNGAKYLFLAIVRRFFLSDLCIRNKIWYFAIALFVLLMFVCVKNPPEIREGFFSPRRPGYFLSFSS
ncbi:MAG TPA: hypothetical protein H9760_05010, partial [Candidatus Alistipes stercoravium]|nr:hypothetical protein [Candidatus Alistipes stercoravium]